MNSDKLESGELELRKVFEEVTTRNVNACVDYSNKTREIVRELELKISHLEKIMTSKDLIIQQMKEQISLLQQKLYNGGTT